MTGNYSNLGRYQSVVCAKIAAGDISSDPFQVGLSPPQSQQL